MTLLQEKTLMTIGGFKATNLGAFKRGLSQMNWAEYIPRSKDIPVVHATCKQSPLKNSSLLKVHKTNTHSMVRNQQISSQKLLKTKKKPFFFMFSGDGIDYCQRRSSALIYMRDDCAE